MSSVGRARQLLVWIVGASLACAVVTLERRARAQQPERPRAAAAGDVTLPELVTFVEAEYPAEAKKLGLEAEVVLALQIDARGKVTDAQVVEPAGRGFDEAAQAAARKFVFQPARRRDKPVAARILYRYEFRLAAPEAPPPVEPGRLEGTLLMSAGDQALAGARIRLARKGGWSREVLTDEKGRFDFGPLEAGDYEVRVDAPGFEALVRRERVADGERLTLTYRLEAAIEPDSTDIVVRGVRPTREVTRRTLSRRELQRVPGTSGDALRALQNLPGVARSPSLSGLLIVRGAGEMTTPVLVDGMWIPNVYHFGGLSSVIPSEMLDEIHFFPGNFSVRYGRAQGGIVDAQLRETREDGRYHGLLQVDLIDARVMLEGPIPLLSGWNFIAAVRRSHVDAWLGALLEDEDTDIVAAPVYYDYQLLADTRPSAKSYLRIGLLGSDDRFEILDESAAAAGTIDSADATWGVGSRFYVAPSDRVSIDLTLTMARLHQQFSVSTIEVDTVAYGSLARGELEYRPHSNLTLRTGYDVLVAPYTIAGQIPESSGPDAPDGDSFLTAPTRAFDEEGLFLQPAAYVEADMAPSRRMKVVTGVRADYTHETRRLDVSPRMSARYDLASGFPRTTLKAGTGLFMQPPGLAEVVLSDASTELRSTRSFQNSLGIEQQLSEHVELSVEGFFNLLDNQIGRGVNDAGVLEYNNFGRGRIFGAEVMLRYADDQRFFGWLSYTLSRSERTWVPGQPSRLFYLDQTHILTALGSYDLGRGWELGGRFRFVTGNLYTPCGGGAFSAISTSYVCFSGSPFSQRLPAFHQLDVRIEKRWVFEDFTFGVYLDLINAYNRSNPDFISYNYDFTESRPQSGSLPIVPSLGLKGEF